MITYKIPLFVLTDCDPHGVDIYRSYVYGSKLDFKFRLPEANCKWIGLRPSQLENIFHDQNKFVQSLVSMEITNREETIVKGLENNRRLHIFNPSIEEELLLFQDTQEKYEIDCISLSADDRLKNFVYEQIKLIANGKQLVINF